MTRGADRDGGGSRGRMSTSTWNPERRFPWLGDSLPCPSPEEEAASEHRCTPPVIAGLTYPFQPDWTCGICGRVWRDSTAGSIRWWAEIRGPVSEQDRAATVRLYGEERVAELEQEANRG